MKIPGFSRTLDINSKIFQDFPGFLQTLNEFFKLSRLRKTKSLVVLKMLLKLVLKYTKQEDIIDKY